MAYYNGSLTNPAYKPTIISKPFAADGARTDIPVAATGTNRASQTEGFPSLTALPINNGGIPPARPDMNSMGYDSQSWAYYVQNGGVAVFDSNVSTAIEGYPIGARLWVSNTSVGTIIVRALQKTTVNPSSVVSNILAGTDTSWALDFSAPQLIVYPAAQEINGNIRCWVRISPDGFIQQGGCWTAGSIPHNTSISIPLVRAYKSLQMGVSVVSVSNLTRTGDNDPANEIGAVCSSISSAGYPIAFQPLPLYSFWVRGFRMSGANNDPTSVIWTSWGV